MDSSKELFQSTQIIYYALIGGVFMMAGVISFISMPLKELSIDFSDAFTLAGIFVALGAISISTLLSNRRKATISGIKTAEEAVADYRTGMIMRVAPLEGAALCAIILMFLTQNPFFFLPAALCLFGMLLARPSLHALQHTYQLPDSEMRKLY